MPPPGSREASSQQKKCERIAVARRRHKPPQQQDPCLRGEPARVKWHLNTLRCMGHGTCCRHVVQGCMQGLHYVQKMVVLTKVRSTQQPLCLLSMKHPQPSDLGMLSRKLLQHQESRPRAQLAACVLQHDTEVRALSTSPNSRAKQRRYEGAPRLHTEDTGHADSKRRNNGDSTARSNSSILAAPVHRRSKH